MLWSYFCSNCGKCCIHLNDTIRIGRGSVALISAIGANVIVRVLKVILILHLTSSKSYASEHTEASLITSH
jgi:Fe-S-cluster containining protein